MLLAMFMLLFAYGQDIKFDEYFYDKTTRADMFITGNYLEEVVSLDEIIEEGE